MFELAFFLSVLPTLLLPLSKFYKPVMKEYKGKVDVIIPIYKSSPSLKKTIESIISKKKFRNVIIVASNPTKKTMEILRKFRIKKIVSKNRLSKYQAINVSMKHVKSRLVLICDADLTLEKIFIPKIDNCIVNFDCYRSKKKDIYSKVENISVLLWTAQQRLNWMVNRITNYGAGGLQLIPRKILLSLKVRNVPGGEADFQFRAIEKGIKNVFCPYAEVYHHGSKSGLINSLKTYRRLGKDAFCVISNHWRTIFSSPSYVFFNLIFLLPFFTLFFSGFIKLFGFSPPLSFGMSFALVLAHFITPLTFLLSIPIYLQIFTFFLLSMIGFILWSISLILTSKLLKQEIAYSLLPLYFFFFAPLITISISLGFLEGIWQKVRYKKVFEEYEGIFPDSPHY